MNTFVVDASFVTKWFLNEPGSEASRKIRATLHLLHAPELLLLEISSVLWKYNLRGELDFQAAQEILEILVKSPIVFHPDRKFPVIGITCLKADEPP